MRVSLQTLRFVTPLLLGLALLATLPAAAQTTAGPTLSQPPAVLQNQLVEKADGTVYVVRDGTRHQVAAVSLSDDDINAIPEGSPYSNGLVPVDAIAAWI